MTVPDAWIEATWYCDQTSQVKSSQRKLPRGLRSSAEVAAVSPYHTRFLDRERVFFGAGILFCALLWWRIVGRRDGIVTTQWRCGGWVMRGVDW
jgi:hypothetical protein